MRVVILSMVSCTAVSAMEAETTREESTAVSDHGELATAFAPVVAPTPPCRDDRFGPSISGVLFRHQLHQQPRPLWIDCRFAPHLEQGAQIMRTRGVSEVIHVGTHAPKLTKNGTPSAHALGMAIDIVAFVRNGETLSVEKDFVRRTSPKIETCKAPRIGPRDELLKSLVCALDGPFNAILTPNWDETHRTHFHLAWHAPGDAPWANSVDPLLPP